MLVHPWDAPADDDEWRRWLADGHDFGQLIVPGQGRDLPVVVPTHFVYEGPRTIWLHLARPNPVWAALDEHPRALLTVIGDYVYAPSEWGRNEGQNPEWAIPTSFYASAQLACDVRIIDDPQEKARLLTRQLDHFEPPDSVRLPVDTEDPTGGRCPASAASNSRSRTYGRSSNTRATSPSCTGWPSGWKSAARPPTSEPAPT